MKVVVFGLTIPSASSDGQACIEGMLWSAELAVVARRESEMFLCRSAHVSIVATANPSADGYGS